MIFLMSSNTYMAAAAQGAMGNPQLMKDIQVLNKITSDYNAQPVKDKGRIEKLLTSFEGLMGRKLNIAEKSFLSLQFATMNVLPSFEVKGNSIRVYDHAEGAKDLVISVEVIDAEKNLFKFGDRVFSVDPNKPLHENIQLILKELTKGEKVSLWQQLNPFAVPQAHAEMANWLKYVIAGAIALIVGIVVYKAINKNKNKGEIAESKAAPRQVIREEEAFEENKSHETVVEPTSEPTPTVGEEPAVV